MCTPHILPQVKAALWSLLTELPEEPGLSFLPVLLDARAGLRGPAPAPHLSDSWVPWETSGLSSLCPVLSVFSVSVSPSLCLSCRQRSLLHCRVIIPCCTQEIGQDV